MKIHFVPQRRDDVFELLKQGSALTINGHYFDFSGIPEGATLPADAIDCEWIAGGVERVDGVLHITLLLPHGSNASASARFPEPITNPEDGPVALPI